MRVIFVLLVLTVFTIGKNSRVHGFKDDLFTLGSGVPNYLDVYQGFLDQLNNPTLESGEKSLSRQEQEEFLNAQKDFVDGVIKTQGVEQGIKNPLGSLQSEIVTVINLSLLLLAAVKSTFQVFSLLKDAEFALEECTNRFPAISSDFNLLENDAEKLDQLTKSYLSSTHSAAEGIRRKIENVANSMMIRLSFVKEEIGACEIRLKNSITTVVSTRDSELNRAVWNLAGGITTGLLVWKYAAVIHPGFVFLGAVISFFFFLSAGLKGKNYYCTGQLLGQLREALKEINGFHREARNILIQITDAKSRYDDEL